jgi:hypothetical protein
MGAGTAGRRWLPPAGEFFDDLLDRRFGRWNTAGRRLPEAFADPPGEFAELTGLSGRRGHLAAAAHAFRHVEQLESLLVASGGVQDRG